MPRKASPKCRQCAKLPASEAIALHGETGDGCWDSRTCPKRRYYYNNRELLNRKRRQGSAADPIVLLPPSVPIGVLHLYRHRADAPLHAVGAELWVGQECKARVEPVHCLGLTPTQIQTYLLSDVLGKLSEIAGEPLGKFAAQVEIDPCQCPIDPCPLRPMH
jgi:hypothetical protein